jgi:7-cyano-7-deazaguanine synthase in queuosine biosynthesis
MMLGKLDNSIVEKKVVSSIDIDKLSRLALLATLAGYKKSHKIEVYDKFVTKKKEISDFINFLLNHKGFAPIKYNIKVNFKKSKIKRSKKKSKPKHVMGVLFSGGIDSTAAILEYKLSGIEPILISLDFGQINNKREQEVIHKLARKLDLKLITFYIDIRKEVLDGWKDWSYIVPARNFLIASLGADTFNKLNLSGDIILAATSEEIKHSNPGPDKSKKFYKFCTKLFSKEYARKINLISPFENKTKAEILSLWKNKFLKEFGISPYNTSTCYYGNECGRCNSCFKRSLALLSSGWELDPKLKTNPFRNDLNKTLNYIERISSADSTFTEERKIDTLIAFLRAEKKNLLFKKAQEKLVPLKNKFYGKIKKRLIKLNLHKDYI